jgi:hypothetical protein
MANQFNTTTHYTQTTSDNTPTSAEFLGQAIFTGDEWLTLINVLNGYESQISDLAEVMPAYNDITTAHPVTGEPVSREVIANEINSIKTLKYCAFDNSEIKKGFNLLFGMDLPINKLEFGDDELALAQINLDAMRALSHAMKHASNEHLDQIKALQSSQQGAKDKATNKAIKYLKNELNNLASINDKLANAIYDIRLYLAQSQADTGNHIAILPPHEAVMLWRDEWFTYCDACQQDSNPASSLDSDLQAYIRQLEHQNQQLKDQLHRQRLAHSDSITTALCQLQSIKTSLFALESVTFDSNPNFEDSREYTLFGTLEYLIKSYMNDRTNEQNQLEQGGDHASI